MAECEVCSVPYPDARAALGYRVCLKCGDGIAKEKTAAKARAVAPAYNKGCYMFITDETDLTSLGRKV